MKAGCWITCHSLPRHFFSGQRSVWVVGDVPRISRLLITGGAVSKAWCCGVHMWGAGGMPAHLVCARFAVPMLHSLCARPRSSLCHSCVPADPQELHEEQRVPLQPAGPVRDPDTSDVLPVHCEDDL